MSEERIKRLENKVAVLEGYISVLQTDINLLISRAGHLEGRSVEFKSKDHSNRQH
ncbi:hypothetical protein [Siminovitchia terrae]|uniref:hypothetical protein n=1 Tax=Siminovitchia terrae TaxID=1914933 RepID=UPI00163CDFB3|nr:hypothetical protein [Siminovitchia terrae]